MTIEEAEHDRWLWASLLAGAGFAGYWAANRRRRKQEEDAAQQAALDQLFACGGRIDDPDEDLELLAAARQTANRLVSAAARAAFAEAETPFDFDTALCKNEIRAHRWRGLRFADV